MLGQRHAEWCGHGPVLEEDIAMANISLDLIGQARLLTSTPGLEARRDGRHLAYFRDEHDFRNYTMLELPHHGPLRPSRPSTTPPPLSATSCQRLDELLWDALQASEDAQLAAIAGKSVKETRYHLRHARDWLVRLGDGTDESHARTQAAVDHLMPYTQEFWTVSKAEAEAVAAGAGVPPASCAKPGRASR